MIIYRGRAMAELEDVGWQLYPSPVVAERIRAWGVGQSPRGCCAGSTPARPDAVYNIKS